jgi:hypothetical protein
MPVNYERERVSCTYLRVKQLYKHLSTGADPGFWLGGQLSDCNDLSGSNSLTNRVLNKKN